MDIPRNDYGYRGFLLEPLAGCYVRKRVKARTQSKDHPAGSREVGPASLFLAQKFSGYYGTINRFSGSEHISHPPELFELAHWRCVPR